MKKLILILMVGSIIFSQDMEGQYKLTGAYVKSTYLTRTEVVLTVSDAYGLGLTITVREHPKGVYFSEQKWQATDATLSVVGINLNVTLNEDGAGEIAEGSYCKNMDTVEDENGACVTPSQVLPITDDFTYESSGNGMAEINIVHPGVNVLGMPSISSHAGEQLGLFEFSGIDRGYCSPYFENVPMIPSHPTLCDDSGNCFDVVTSDGSVVPGGSPLPGYTGGYFLKRGVNIGDLSSIYPGNTDPDLYLEWNSIDGTSSGLGFGEDDSVDEDGDGTWFDRVEGIPGITATFLNPACGFNRPIYGDVSDVFEAMGLGSCVDAVASAASGYLMDASFATWGNFFTANAAQFDDCLSSSNDMATCTTLYGADDSDHDFNGVDGRLIMNFDIPCVGIIEAREFIAEFIEVGGCVLGDVNGDGALNVLDVVALENQILSDVDVDDICTGDMNEDDGLDILDLTMLIYNILDEYECDDPDSTIITISDSSQNDFIISIDSVCVKGLQISLEGNFTFDDNGVHIISTVSDGVTLALIVDLEGQCIPNEISMSIDPNINSSFGIHDIIAAGCHNYIPNTLELDFQYRECTEVDECGICGGDNACLHLEDILLSPDHFSIHSIYPNPFNPITKITYGLPENKDVHISVYNIVGTQVFSLVNSFQTAGYHSINWNASSYPSGVYLIRMDSGDFTQTQKVLLVK